MNANMASTGIQSDLFDSAGNCEKCLNVSKTEQDIPMRGRENLQ